MPSQIDTLLTPTPSRSAASRVGIRGRPPWRAAVLAAVAIALAGVGVGGYLIGNSPEADLDAVRATAAANGREAGAERGTEEGYRQGFRAAQDQSYSPAARSAYKDAYAAEFEAVGLDPPERIRVPSP